MDETPLSASPLNTENARQPLSHLALRSTLCAAVMQRMHLYCNLIAAHQITTCHYQQVNKGIYLERTPAETAVERAHLAHTLKHGLAHRPDLAELSHKGVYLEVSGG